MPNGPAASRSSSLSATWPGRILPQVDPEGPTATAAPASDPAHTRTGS